MEQGSVPPQQQQPVLPTAPSPDTGSTASARAPAARLRKQARLPGWRNAVLRLVAGILRVFILFGVPALVVLALSLVLVDR